MLEPFYKFASPVALNPAKSLLFSQFGSEFTLDTKFAEVFARLREVFPYPVWLHCLIPPLSLVDTKSLPGHHATNSILVIDILTDKPMTYAQRKHILNKRLPVLGINTQPLMGHAYTSPTVPESHGMELSYCLENLREDHDWAKMYSGIVAKKLSSPYDIYPQPATATASRCSLFWHYHPFSAPSA